MKTGHLRHTGSVDSEQRANASATDESRDGSGAESEHIVDFMRGSALFLSGGGWNSLHSDSKNYPLESSVSTEMSGAAVRLCYLDVGYFSRF